MVGLNQIPTRGSLGLDWIAQPSRIGLVLGLLALYYGLYILISTVTPLIPLILVLILVSRPTFTTLVRWGDRVSLWIQGLLWPPSPWDWVPWLLGCLVLIWLIRILTSLPWPLGPEVTPVPPTLQVR